MISASMVAKTIQGAMTIAEKEKNFELVEKLRELQSELLDLQENYQKLKGENMILKNEREDKVEFEKTFFYDSKKYVSREESIKHIECFCSACWDDKQKRIRLHVTHYDYFEIYLCPVCKIEFNEQTRQQRLSEIQNAEAVHQDYDDSTF